MEIFWQVNNYAGYFDFWNCKSECYVNFDMSVELFITNLDFLTKLQAVFNLNDFILNFNVTQINVQGGIFSQNQ